MPRYLIERCFPGAVTLRAAEIVKRNLDDGVTWLHSYVSDDSRCVFDVYDAPSPEALRRTSARNNLPVERITEVRTLDPYPYEEARR